MNGAYLIFVYFLTYSYIFIAESSLLIRFILCFLILFTHTAVNLIIFEIFISLINIIAYLILLNFYIFISIIFYLIILKILYLSVKKKLYLYWTSSLICDLYGPNNWRLQIAAGSPSFPILATANSFTTVPHSTPNSVRTASQARYHLPYLKVQMDSPRQWAANWVDWMNLPTLKVIIKKSNGDHL